MLIHRSILSAILLIGLLPTNPVLAEQKTTSKASYGYAITVNEKMNSILSLDIQQSIRPLIYPKKDVYLTTKVIASYFRAETKDL
ncbi:hypothetical protein HC766_03860 [Candidatus Gracilibacteria bacterium]|nr:hypothetical protein [Candidatus Gracilibacteria bacterium]